MEVNHSCVGKYGTCRPKKLTSYRSDLPNREEFPPRGEFGTF